LSKKTAIFLRTGMLKRFLGKNEELIAFSNADFVALSNDILLSEKLCWALHLLSLFRVGRGSVD
jgi:hypothetical protein